MTVYGSLGDLSDAKLQAALDRFELGRLVSAEAFTGGLFAKNVGIVTDTGRWVLRGDSPAWRFRRERFWASTMRVACPTVPVPWPFHIDTDESLFGWPYQLTPWMPGNQERNDANAVALGRAAATMRSVTFDYLGEWSPETETLAPFGGTAIDYLATRTERVIARCAERARPLLDTDVTFLRRLMPDALDVVPSYVHHDLKIENCVFIDGAVSGLFDLGEGLVADPIENLARPMWTLARFDVPLAAKFLDAYEVAADIRVPRHLLRTYVLLDLLVIWEYQSSQRGFNDPSFEGWVPALANPVDQAIGLRLHDL